MKREVNKLDFFMSPVDEVGPNYAGAGSVRENGLPFIPCGDKGSEEAVISHRREKLQLALKIAACIAFVAIFVGIGIAMFA